MTTEPTQANPYESRDHESQQIDNDDIVAVATLFNRVGGELTTVDHQNVGGGSIKAQKLDPNVVISAKPGQVITPQQALPGTPHGEPFPEHVKAAPTEAPPVQPLPTNIQVDKNLITRIATLEKTVASLSKLYENILKRLANKPKKITITL